MATTIINPAPSNDSSGGNGMGFLVGGVVLVVLVILFFVYGLPYLRTLGGDGGIQVNVPKTIDVNVQQTQ